MTNIPDEALTIAVKILKKRVSGPPVEADIVSVVQDVLRIPGFGNIDSSEFVKQLKFNLNMFIEGFSVISKDYTPWLTAKSNDIAWRFWNRYKEYLETEKSIPQPVLKELHRVTDAILDYIHDPADSKSWSRKGLVVGSVQSGKTSNYTALVCKAIDAGYKMVIVLAGMHEDLRTQTQIRIDEGVIGLDTSKGTAFDQKHERVGVGAMAGAQLYTIHPKTTSAPKGDFKKEASAASPVASNEPFILVMKKNKRILENFLKWVLATATVVDPKNPDKKVLKNVPLLLIDDEADNASVNTAEIYNDNGEIDPDLEPKTINRLIRRILASFDQSAYVGYTATPQANILIPEGIESDTYNEDIFPESFIFNLGTPDNYYDTDLLFNSQHENPEINPVFKQNGGLLFIRRVDDSEQVFPPKHKKDLVVKVLPDTLKLAIRHFILVMAARNCRGHLNRHNSMLVHVTRFNDVQEQVKNLIEEEVEYIANLLKAGVKGGASQLLSELKSIWQQDFVETTIQAKKVVEFDDFSPITWEQVAQELIPAVSKVEVKVLNSKAKDAIQYKLHEASGLNVIALGGDKLSRGMTLEGLTISYFIRQSRMYDTLQQMGRWFGYKPGYGDLCRTFTNPVLVLWYRHIDTAMKDLREQFDTMSLEGLSPKEFGLKVMDHAGTLLVTSQNKMRAGVEIKMGYSGERVVGTVFSLEKTAIENNFQALDVFLKQAGHSQGDGAKIWKSVAANLVVDFLNHIKVPETASHAHPKPISSFIAKQQSRKCLTEWTVVLTAGLGDEIEIGGVTVNRVKRLSGVIDGKRFSIKNPMSKQDETLDLDEAEKKIAVDVAKQIAKDKNDGDDSEYSLYMGQAARRVRPKERGLLIVYPIEGLNLSDYVAPNRCLIAIAYSFPEDENSEKIDYIANEVLRRELFDDAA
jgi:hypothetical protein